MTILRIRDVCAKTGISRRWIYELEKQGRFPARRRIGQTARSVGWLEAEIDAWINGESSPVNRQGMPWYPNAFLDATRGWPLLARGLYRELLDANWMLGHLPSHSAELQRIVKCSDKEWRQAWPLVSPKFSTDTDGRLFNARLEEHRQKRTFTQQAKKGAA